MNPASSAALMRKVMLALLPGTAAMIYWFGWGVLANIVLSCSAAITTEALVLILRRRAVVATIGDGSALLAGWLLALTLPPLLPWWLTVLGAMIALLLGKHLFGGLGFNPFNPAMVGYAVLLVSFPTELTAWIQPQALSIPAWDAISMATPLDQFKTVLRSPAVNITFNETALLGLWAGKGWEWINLGFLLGGLWMMLNRTIDWRIPTSLLLVLAALHGLDYLLTESGTVTGAAIPVTLSPWFALFSGATMLGAFFIATDPVSAATSPTGRLWFAAGIGALVFVIRKWGAYPEGMAFAVLLMNLTAPLIDYYCRPRAFGQ